VGPGQRLPVDRVAGHRRDLVALPGERHRPAADPGHLFQLAGACQTVDPGETIWHQVPRGVRSFGGAVFNYTSNNTMSAHGFVNARVDRNGDSCIDSMHLMDWGRMNQATGFETITPVYP
jgi:hypothetical protein